MKTLKIKNKAFFGMLMILPIIGEVTLTDEGTFETDDDQLVDLLTTKTNDWELVTDESEGFVKGKKDDVVKGKFDDLTLEELIEMSVAMQYPEKEYSKYKKNQKLMVKYLNKKQAEADAAA